MITKNENPKTHNGVVEQILDKENLNYSLQQLPHTVLGQTDDKMFQTRPSSGDDKSKVVDDDRVAQLCESISRGYLLSAVVLFLFNGKYITCDGRHRLAAYIRSGFKGQFSAYVIEDLNEAEINDKGKRLSCLLNDINGERAGDNSQQKTQRAVTLNECARRLFILFPHNIPSNQDIKKIAALWDLGDGSRTSLKEKFFQFRLDVMYAAAGFTGGKNFRQADSEVLFKLVYRAELNQRKDLLDTLIASANQSTNEAVMVAVKQHVENQSPVSEIIDSLRNQFCLNSDNTDKAVHIRVATKYISDVTRSGQYFLRLLSHTVPLFGDDKEAFFSVIKKIQNACDLALCSEEEQ